MDIHLKHGLHLLQQYDKQKKKKLINCPICNSNKIRKSLWLLILKEQKSQIKSYDEKVQDKNKKFNKKLKEFKKI